MKNIKTKDLLNLKELQQMAKELKIKSWWTLKKDQLITEIEKITDTKPEEKTVEEVKEVKMEEEPTDENLITLKELIAEAGIKGTKARRLLRGTDIERPYKRWEWHKVEHKDIIEKVRKTLK